MATLRLYFLFAVIVIAVLSACVQQASPGTIEVRDAWVRAAALVEMGTHMEMGGTTTPAASMETSSAAYFVLQNGSDQAERLMGAESEAAQVVEMHHSELVGDVMTMRQVESIEIPAGSQVELLPGGYHLMLIGLKQDLDLGQQIALVLRFEEAGEILVQAEVRPP